jgi:uncharacterized phage protein (TIGR02220 family)
MNILRVVKDKNYTTINNTIFRDKNISCKAKGFFATIMSLPPDWDFSVNGIKQILLEGKSSVYSFIDELESNGYLKRNQTRDQNGKMSLVEYTFFETPMNKEIVPHTDLPHTVKPLTENRPQLSTNIIKDLNNKTNAIDFDALLVFFNKTTGKNIRLINPKSKSQFLARLKEGYTKEDICRAIINCSTDNYHVENPKYLTPEFISRSDKMEKYANATTKQIKLPEDWFSRELTKEQINLLTPSQKKSWEHNKNVIAIEGGYLKPIIK